MKKLGLAFIAIMLFSWPILGQYATVSFEEEMVQLNGGAPIPSEKNLLITGAIPTDISIVELSVFTSKGKQTRDALYMNQWLRPNGNLSTQYKIPLNFKLRSGKEYDFKIQYFRPISSLEQTALYEKLADNLDTYVDQSFEVSKKKLSLLKKTKHIINDMNDIVNAGLSQYRNIARYDFPGFSDIVRNQLDKIGDTKLKKAKDAINVANQTDAKHIYRENLINDLKKMVKSEVQFVLNNEWNALLRTYHVDNAETEKRNGHFAVNFGYGAVFLDGNTSNINYGTAPYIGLAFPLSTSTIAPKFFRNASITVGVFTKDFTNDAGLEITGPIVKKPVYLGLDYRLFQFIRFNAGATFLEEASEHNGQVSGIEKRVFIRPFVGLSAKINISLGLDK